MSSSPSLISINKGIFLNTVLTSRVKIHPSRLVSGVKNAIQEKLASQYEGFCSKFGFIRPSSIQLIDIGNNCIEKHTFSGYVLFDVRFKCDICNPCRGDIILAKVKNINKFGIMSVSGYLDDNMQMISIIEVVTPKCSTSICTDKDIINNVSIDDTVEIEVLGKKVKAFDKKICLVGRIMKRLNNVNISTTSYKTGKQYTHENDDKDSIISYGSDIELDEIEDIDLDDDDVDLPNPRKKGLDGEVDGSVAQDEHENESLASDVEESDDNKGSDEDDEDDIDEVDLEDDIDLDDEADEEEDEEVAPTK